MEDKSSVDPLIFGFDIGIASVGWAVLAPNRIVALGVRAFDKAETAKEGDSLNLVRRTARLMRNRLRRRAARLKKLSRVLMQYELVDDPKFFSPERPYAESIWRLRLAGLDRKLSPEEWARVIYHLCKHRGFHWTSRAEEKKAEADTKGEGGKVKQGLAGTAKLMQSKGYRTLTEMVLAEFPDAQRNKQGDYGKALARVGLGEEFALLFKRQRELGNALASEKLEFEILGTGSRKDGLFWEKKPALAGAALLKMLGKCTFERSEYRAPKASFTAERHVWLTRLNNLRVAVGGEIRPLHEVERRLALPLPYQQAGDFTYKQLRSALVKAGHLPEAFRFVGLAYPSKAQQEDSNAKDPEKATLTKLPAWQELRLALKKASLEPEWLRMSGQALDGDPTHLDQISWVLSVYKDDDEVEAKLTELSLPGDRKMVEVLLGIRFDKFHALSLKALRKIVPHMESGLRYDEACEKAAYHHSQLFKVGDGDQKYLPSFYSDRDKNGRMVFQEDADIPRNPVVLRSLNQARKVMNALVRKYGSPHSVHIEMARDLSRPMDERNKVRKAQDEYRDRNEKDKEQFAECFGRPPKGVEFEKWRLYREQQGKCAYSVEPIDMHRLLEPGYVEIDHALPYSRSFDDSKNNKVLVHAKENRNKGNRTPYEYMKGSEDSERWRAFAAFVESNKAYRLAKRSRLLRKEFGGKESLEFRERNLNDTRYICRFFKNYVERFLQLADGSTEKRCVVVSGMLTSFLRARWGLIKMRGESDRHHALDAVVVAACSHSMVQRLSNYARRKELDQVQEGFADGETGEIINPAMFQQLREHFPDPWPQFRDELEARLKIDDVALLRAEMESRGTYPAEALDQLRPLFVSRAPQRRNGGAAHKDTIYAQPERLRAQGGVVQKVPLTSLTMKDLDKLIDPHRNERLYAAIRQRLEAHAGKADKAFAPENPLRKPDRNGEPTGPVVRSVNLVIDKLSGVQVRGGIAKNDSMLRVDVFRKGGKFHLVPLYVYHRAGKALPNRAIVAFKDESEWTEIDDSFEFCFSLFPNDLVRVTQKGGEALFGYYRGCHSGTGAINISLHDRYAYGDKTTSLSLFKKHPDKPLPNDKLGLIEGVGVKLAANLEKFHVDTLGNTYPSPKESRRGLA